MLVAALKHRIIIAVLAALPFQLAGCLSRLQQEIEVLLAPEVTETALRIPDSIVFNLFGNLLF